MAIIQINLNITNAEEVLHAKKSELTSFIADLALSDKKIKKKVEEEVCKQLVKQLKEKIETGLIEEGVKAELEFSIITKKKV
ncbi:hypothetical protein [Sporocytophaga myxococcoides]|uniref:hypothetical protein n=1 Tax=Sporocytophaga myxococcoides TaxID=153721 RepID=UPI00040F590F|nr:hypothetical protein [Sporocytophaga myxococcoides]